MATDSTPISTLEPEHEDLLRQARQISSQLASIEASAATPQSSRDGNFRFGNSSIQLSEAFFLECERDRAAAAAAAGERQAERERAERAERMERERAERLERLERQRAEISERETRLIVTITFAMALLGSVLLLKKA